MTLKRIQKKETILEDEVGAATLKGGRLATLKVKLPQGITTWSDGEGVILNFSDLADASGFLQDVVSFFKEVGSEMRGTD